MNRPKWITGKVDYDENYFFKELYRKEIRSFYLNTVEEERQC